MDKETREKLLNCLHANEIKRLEDKIRWLEDKVRDTSIRMAEYCADYENKLAYLKGRRIIDELEGYKYAYQYLNEQNRMVNKKIEDLVKYIETSMKLLKNEQSKYKDFIASSKLGIAQPTFSIEPSKAIEFLNILVTKLDANKDLPKDKELFEKLKKLQMEKEENLKGFRRYINPQYNGEQLLKELHPLIDGHGCKEHVPYILILLEEKALNGKPTWTEMREEFKNIGAKSNSNYCKFLKYSLTPLKTAECYDIKEVESKRSVIKDILEKCKNNPYAFPF